MKSITWLGAVLALFGLLGLAIPVFTTSQTKDVVSLGTSRSRARSNPPIRCRWRSAQVDSCLVWFLLAPELIHDARHSRASESAM
jgi:hypothetical protein